MLILPGVPRGRKPAGLTTADVVRANCARLGLPVPSSLIPFVEGAGGALDVMTGQRGALTGATWENDGVLSDANSERVTFSTPLVRLGTHPVGTAAFLWRQTNANSTVRHLVSAQNVTYFGVLQTSSTGVWQTYPGTGSGTYATAAGGTYHTTFRWGAGAGLLRINGADVITSGGANMASDSTSTTLCNRVADTGRHLNGVMQLAAIWREQLTPAQIATWEADPYALLAQPPRRLWFDLGAGGGTSKISAELAALFDVRALVGAEFQAVFDVGGKTASEIAARFDVLNRTSAELVARFDVLNAVAAELGCRFDVFASVSGELLAVFDVRGRAASELVAAFDMGGRVSSEVVLVFDLGGGQALWLDAGNLTLVPWTGRFRDWSA